MRRCLGGNGQDTTAAVAAYLKGHELMIRNLYLIGDADNPYALWLTDHESPLQWNPWGIYNPAIITRGTVSTKVGLEVSNLEVTWAPRITAAITPGGHHSVILNWTASTDSGASGFLGYNIYRSTASGAPRVMPINSSIVAGTTYTDLTVAGGATYYYQITAVVNAGEGNVETAMPPEISVTVPGTDSSLTPATAGPYTLARTGYFDNWAVRIWSCYMPTPGDANTLGCSELFGGRVASTVTGRGRIVLTLNSFLDVVNEYVPLNVVQITSTLAGNVAATPPRGFQAVPQFDVLAGSTDTTVIGDCTSPDFPGQIFDTNSLQFGYLVFNGGPGATLAGYWSAVMTNYRALIGATVHNGFVLFSPLPWPPTPGVDTFYVSAAAPVDIAEGAQDCFPYVPAPELAV